MLLSGRLVEKAGGSLARVKDGGRGMLGLEEIDCTYGVWGFWGDVGGRIVRTPYGGGGGAGDSTARGASARYHQRKDRTQDALSTVAQANLLLTNGRSGR